MQRTYASPDTRVVEIPVVGGCSVAATPTTSELAHQRLRELDARLASIASRLDGVSRRRMMLEAALFRANQSSERILLLNDAIFETMQENDRLARARESLIRSRRKAQRLLLPAKAS